MWRCMDSGEEDLIEKAFIDVRIFNPSAQSNLHGPLSSVYRKHEQEKRREYDQRVHEIQYATFTPLVHALHNRWNGTSCNNILQETCINDS